MSKHDRLTTLIDRFKLAVAPAPLRKANLLVRVGTDETPARAIFRSRGVGFDADCAGVVFSARVDWTGQLNPLLSALPETVEVALTGDGSDAGLVRLMQTEIEGQRCGADAVLNRLGEVLVVRMMRAQIEAGASQPGLLAGLADPRLSRAIVAMHDRPGQLWRNADLAQIAGMSLSRFAETFFTEVGEPPAAYLRRWRLTLARQDIEKGDRVDAVAGRYGFGSPEGFARAFRKHYDTSPIDLRLRNSRRRQAASAGGADAERHAGTAGQP